MQILLVKCLNFFFSGNRELRKFFRSSRCITPSIIHTIPSRRSSVIVSEWCRSFIVFPSLNYTKDRTKIYTALISALKRIHSAVIHAPIHPAVIPELLFKMQESLHYDPCCSNFCTIIHIEENPCSISMLLTVVTPLLHCDPLYSIQL